MNNDIYSQIIDKKIARIAHNNQIKLVTIDDNGNVYHNNKVISDEFAWLPPTTGNMFALGLNYADHASELEFKPPTSPLVFLKTPNAYVGHNGYSWRPDNVEYMHYEAELVVVIGKPAKRVSRENAMEYVFGYTVTNDYAIRDYLENYLRPNLRVKNRDAMTPVGPWIVPKSAVSNPHNLVLKTYLNDKLVQQGSTSDLIFDIPYLISYLSQYQTLQAGDMIATGTPKGLTDVKAGDKVVVEVEGIGQLQNNILSETDWLATRNHD